MTDLTINKINHQAKVESDTPSYGTYVTLLI